MEVDNQLKEGTKLIQQKGIPIPIHLQPAVKKGFKKLKKHGHIGVAKIFAENCFMRPTVITMQKDKSVKFSRDSRNPNKTPAAKHRDVFRYHHGFDSTTSRLPGRRTTNCATVTSWSC